MYKTYISRSNEHLLDEDFEGAGLDPLTALRDAGLVSRLDVGRIVPLADTGATVLVFPLGVTMFADAVFVDTGAVFLVFEVTFLEDLP